MNCLATLNSGTCLLINLGVCILLHVLVLDQVEGFPSNATLFQKFFTIFSNYLLYVSVVRQL
jgi:hypothetical protein